MSETAVVASQAAYNYSSVHSNLYMRPATLPMVADAGRGDWAQAEEKLEPLRTIQI